MKFTVFGVKIEITFLFCAVLCFLLLTDRTGLIIPVLAASLIHEAGHLFCMWAADCAPISIKLIPASVQITRHYKSSVNRDIAVSFCGPLVNICVFAALYLNYNLYKRDYILTFAAVNLIIGLFNLLPINGLDGGSVLVLLLSKKMHTFKAESIVFFIGIFVSSAVFLFGVYLYLSGKFNLSVIIMAVYLFICTFIKK